MAALRDPILIHHKSNAAHSRQGEMGRENSAVRTKVWCQPREAARCERPSEAGRSQVCPLGADSAPPHGAELIEGG